jgi:hypothetical protein
VQLAGLFQAMSGATIRSGAGAVFGVEASPRSIGLEPLIRAWFASHMLANIYKLLYNLPPVSAPVEVTRDGNVSMPLNIVITQPASKDAAREVVTAIRESLTEIANLYQK